jgi:integrase
MAFAPRPLPSGRYQSGFRHPVTKRHITKTFDYEWEAEAWAVHEESKALEMITAPEVTGAAVIGVTPAVWHGPTIADYGRAYLDRRAGMLARNTRNKYASFLTGMATPVGKTGDLTAHPIGTLKRAEVEQWITDSINAGVGRPTINGRLSLLRQLYADLTADGDAPIQRDPTHGIKKLTEDLDDDRILKPSEEVRLLAAADDQLRLAILVALDAGLRWQEVYALRAGAIFSIEGPDKQTEADFISVHRVIDGNEIRAYPKGKRKRNVATTLRLAEALAEVIKDKDDDDPLFPGAGGNPVDYDNWSKRVWAPTLYRVGLAERIEVPTSPLRVRKTGPNAGTPIMQVRYQPEIGFHGLRHTYGSRLAAKGVPTREIARLMGHAQFRTTERYIHAGDDGRRLSLVREVLGA